MEYNSFIFKCENKSCLNCRFGREHKCKSYYTKINGVEYRFQYLFGILELLPHKKLGDLYVH